MKISYISLNSWVLAKISSFLSSKEGFLIESSEENSDYVKCIVRDSFGYRHEIQIQTLSRIENDEKYRNEVRDSNKDVAVSPYKVR